MKRYVPEFVKRPIRKRRLDKRLSHIMNLKHPELLVLETTTRCNSSCFYCGRPKIDHDMDIDLFKAIIDAVPFVKEVHPNTRGEPLLYPHLIEAIKYCKDKGKVVQFYTNGSLLDRRMTEELFNVGLDRIVFSIDDCDPVRFGLSRSGLDFYKILRNVRRMITLRDACRFPTRISVRATLTNLNRDHQAEISEFWSFVDRFNFVPQLDVIPCEIAASNPFSHNERPLYCPDPFRTLAVRWDGQPVLCCNDWYDNFPIAPKFTTNVTSEDIISAFENNQFYGERMLEGSLPSICVGCRNRKQG